tara:strand:- start:169 stop:366 length:198 start_codon:yes stop_codon:yes gene_type:complete
MLVQVLATPPFWPQTVMNNFFNIFPTLDNILFMSIGNEIKIKKSQISIRNSFIVLVLKYLLNGNE